MMNIFKRILSVTLPVMIFLTMAVSVFAAGEQNAAGLNSPGGQLTTMLIYFGIIAVFFYVIMYLPQKKRMKAEQNMRNSLELGDDVIMTSGIMGKVVNIKDDEVTIETGAARTQIKFIRSAIAKILKNTDAVKASAADDKKVELQKKLDEKLAKKEEKNIDKE